MLIMGAKLIHFLMVGHNMKVVVDGVCGGSWDLLSGAPQDSVVGPVLFLVYNSHYWGCVVFFQGICDN